MASSKTEGAPSPQERRRSLAARACDTCRRRRVKCDEVHPICGTCDRSKLKCAYEAPPPSRRDDVLLRFSDLAERLDEKQNALEERVNDILAELQRLKPVAAEPQKSHTPSTIHGSHIDRGSRSNHIFRLTPPHRVILWPAVRQLLLPSTSLTAADLECLKNFGSAWFLKKERERYPGVLSCEDGLPSSPAPSWVPSITTANRVLFPDLHINYVQSCWRAYLATFHELYPVLDAASFEANYLSRVVREGYGFGDYGSVLVLLVTALGCVATEVEKSALLAFSYSSSDGFRGRTTEDSLGLRIFNEARRRIGFLPTCHAPEIVQIKLLQAVYLDTSARHADYAGMVHEASASCQMLVQSHLVEEISLQIDLISRLYWSCVLFEDFSRLELDMPRSGINLFEEKVPLPYSNTVEQRKPPLDAFHQYYFLALVSLRKHMTVTSTIIAETESIDDRSSEDTCILPPFAIIEDVSGQIDQWRYSLPEPLQWRDDTEVTDIRHAVFRGECDMMSAQLRTRFHYAKYLAFRPFLYKALHAPDTLHPKEQKYCAVALVNACLWPLTFAPVRERRRLIPHFHAWTHNALSVLIILSLTRTNERLRTICEKHATRGMVDQTIVVLLDWLHDARHFDAAAAWGWEIRGQLLGRFQDFYFT